MKKIIPILACMLLASGCVPIKSQLVRQASFDHNCPADRIQIVKEYDGLIAYDVDVCGNRRKYRDIGEKHLILVDVTDGLAAAPTP